MMDAKTERLLAIIKSESEAFTHIFEAPIESEKFKKALALVQKNWKQMELEAASRPRYSAQSFIRARLLSMASERR